MCILDILTRAIFFLFSGFWNSGSCSTWSLEVFPYIYQPNEILRLLFIAMVTRLSLFFKGTLISFHSQVCIWINLFLLSDANLSLCLPTPYLWVRGCKAYLYLFCIIQCRSLSLCLVFVYCFFMFLFRLAAKINNYVSTYSNNLFLFLTFWSL